MVVREAEMSMQYMFITTRQELKRKSIYNLRLQARRPYAQPEGDLTSEGLTYTVASLLEPQIEI